MSYTPITPDEAARLSLKPEGTYAFDVLEAADGTSKKGNSMIAVTLGFYDDNGDRFSVKDWLVHSDNRWAEKKFFDFANTANLSVQYSAGTLKGEDCLGKSGFAMVGIEKGKPKDGGGNFPDRNVVKYYVAAKPEAKKAQPTDAQLANTAGGAAATVDDGDIPF